MPGRLSRLALIVVALAALGAGAGCATSKSVVPTGILEADKYLFERGTQLTAKRKWLQAREYYRQLVDNYPQSVYRPDAKLGLGDTYLGEKTAESLVLAQNEYREFLTFYPTNPRSDYAQLKLGLSHFEQMLAPDRDQTETKETVAEFTLFVQRYPNSPLLPEGKAKLREAQSRLSESDYRVGYFYFRSRWYPGAIERLRAVLKEDPEYPNRDAVYFYLGESMMKIGRPAEAVPYYDRLIKEFEKSVFLPLAQKAIEVAKAPPAPAPVKPVKKK